jgi:hypothetical protein
VQEQYFLSSEYKFLLVLMVPFVRNEKDAEHEVNLKSNSEGAIDSGLDENVTVGCDNNASGGQVHIWSRPQCP